MKIIKLKLVQLKVSKLPHLTNFHNRLIQLFSSIA